MYGCKVHVYMLFMYASKLSFSAWSWTSFYKDKNTESNDDQEKESIICEEVVEQSVPWVH